ncbi:hypothetical protein BLL42_21765 [Pseudomonas frederiksbergensis]|uniref:Uncharacterized protein n=1 Tax=Pseudomonas frederiksbergensis TaxID=104087 RepID=A0A1J0EQK7_9PSED|nr:hypothetical protein [Pseudomonas frederiksbergensis]APC18223.1 hypothetical protein BLL42_21765 [Pseudomonas frederiksbergensis]
MQTAPSKGDSSVPTTSSPTTAQAHSGQLQDYELLLTALRREVGSLSRFSQTLLRPSAFSPLDQENETGQGALQQLIKDSDYRTLCQKNKVSPDYLIVTLKDEAFVYETSNRDGADKTELTLTGNATWQGLQTQIEKSVPLMGGQIRYDRLVSVPRIATFYGMTPWDPTHTADHQAASDALREKIASYKLGLEEDFNIMDLKRVLSSEDRQVVFQGVPTADSHDELHVQFMSGKIKNAIQTFLPDGVTSPLTHLANDILESATPERVRALPTVFLKRVLQSPDARKLGEHLLSTMDWYGAKPGEESSPHIRVKVIANALQIWFKSQLIEYPDSIAGYDLQSRSNYGKSYQDIRAEFERHLLTSKRAVSEKEAIVMARLYLSQFPAEFRITDIPTDLPYKSSAVWVNFVHGLSLAEARVPDRVRHMSFQQLVDFPLQQSIEASAEELEIIACCRIPPALDWANANGVVRERADSTYSDEEQERALTALEKHTDALKKAIQALDADPPKRTELAEGEMWQLFGHPLFISDGRMLIQDFGDDNSGGFIQTPTLKEKTYSFRDVYMSGMLRTKKWFVTARDGQTKTTARIQINADGEVITTSKWILDAVQQRKLPDLEKLFTSQFNAYLSSSKSAYQTVLESLFSSLPHDNRQAIEYGEVKVYTLRRATSDRTLKNETPAITLPLRLRMGFIVEMSHNGKTSYYECLPRVGIIRKREDFSASMLNGKLNSETVDAVYVDETITVRRAKGIPFDWAAHETGSQPQKNASCDAIIDQFGEAFTAITPDGYPIPISSNRASEVAIFISKKFFYYDEDKLLDAARAETELERKAKRPHWLHSVKDFLPFYGSIQDLNSEDPNRKAWGIFGLLVDIASFAFPIGKFVSGTAKLASTAARSGYRAALPKFSTLSRKLLVSSAQNLNPIDGLPSLFKGTARGVYRVNTFALRAAVKKIERLAGRSGRYDFVNGLPQITDPGRYRLLAATDDLASIKGIDDVPVRNVGSSASADFRMIDPISAKPYGPRLASNSDNLSLGRSAYQTLAKTDHHITVELAEKAKVREVLEVDGRTTMFIDDVPYRLDGDTLRRVGMFDDSAALKLIPCRPRRAPEGTTCPISYVNGKPFATPTAGSFDETKDYAPWFGDRISTPDARPGQDQSFLALDGVVYQGSGNTLTKFDGDLTTLGFSKKWLVPNKTIPATLEFQKGIYGRIMVKGTYEGANDSHKVGAIVAQSLDESTTYVFTRLNTDKYYVATLLKGQDLREPLVLNRLLKADVAPGTVGAELQRVYTGSLSANNIARIHGVDALERAMKTMDEIAIPIGTTAAPTSNMKWLKVDTSPSEALMFDHSTRMIVTKLENGATTWSRSKVAPEAFRQRTVEIFDTLFLEPSITLKNADSALRIDSTMKKLHDLIPRKQRPRNPRNIAYAEVTKTDGKREVYVSVSGAQGATGHLPLFKRNLGADQINVDETTYFNIDMNEVFPSTSLHVTDQGKLLAIPPTIKNVGSYYPALSHKPTSLDSESKLISVIREKYPDTQTIKSVDVATTMPPCDSCSVVLKEFGYDGGGNALNVLWH